MQKLKILSTKANKLHHLPKKECIGYGIKKFSQNHSTHLTGFLPPTKKAQHINNIASQKIHIQIFLLIILKKNAKNIQINNQSGFTQQ
jgi:hypothetical protein